MNAHPVESLLSNATCEVVRRASRLECETGLTVFDWALAALAWCGAAVALRFVVDGRAGSPQLAPAVVVLMVCIVGAWQVHRRMSAVGRVTVDADAKLLVRDDGHGRDRRWNFADVRRLEVREDGFDASRPELFPATPSWIEVELADGTVLHLAKGSVDELRPVLETLQHWKLSAPVG